MPESIEIVLNGEKRQIQAGQTLNELIQELGVGRNPVAVEVNEEILKRSQWGERVVHPGDRVEVVHFVGGGRK